MIPRLLDNAALEKLCEKRVFEVFPDHYTGTAVMNRGTPHKHTQSQGEYMSHRTK